MLRKTFLLIGLLVGVVLVGLGATWRYWISPQTFWTAEQAKEYTDAWIALKSAATSGVRRADPKSDQNVAAAQARFDKSQAALDKAVGLRDHAGTYLSVAGCCLVIACAWMLWSNPDGK
jgi:hypothetical protein